MLIVSTTGADMADIFISYAQKDRGIAGELARFLKDFGYDVWWDPELVGGVTFRKEIKAQLTDAKAAIVIWTKNSVESEWVIEESEDAKAAKKLLPTRIPELEFGLIPFGFRSIQTDLVTEPDLVLRSLQKFGVAPSQPPITRTAEPVNIAGDAVDPAALAAADQFANWERRQQ